MPRWLVVAAIVALSGLVLGTLVVLAVVPDVADRFEPVG